MNTYHVEIRNGQIFLERFTIDAPYRGKAVHRAQLYFWYKYLGRMGAVNQRMVVNDPKGEVKYSDSFSCRDKMNRLLPSDVIVRLINESRGELERDLRAGRPHFPAGSVRRKRRRRDFGKFIAPNIRQMKSGKLYYRVITQTQRSRSGRIYRKRKIRDIPLASRSLQEAVIEIERRGLSELNVTPKKRRIFFRDMTLLKWVCGLCNKPTNIPRGFKKVLEHYSSLAISL